MSNFWMYVSLAGIFVSQILVGMYISIFIYEGILKNDDSKPILSGSTDSNHCSLADIHNHKIGN